MTHQLMRNKTVQPYRPARARAAGQLEGRVVGAGMAYIGAAHALALSSAGSAVVENPYIRVII